MDLLLQHIAKTSNELVDLNSIFHHSYLSGFEQLLTEFATTSDFCSSVETSSPRHTSLVHGHIHFLPPELLSSIFQILVDEPFHGWETQTGSMSYA